MRYRPSGCRLATASALVDARASALAVEAERTVVLDREALIEMTDAHGIAVVGIDAAAMAERRR